MLRPRYQILQLRWATKQSPSSILVSSDKWALACRPPSSSSSQRRYCTKMNPAGFYLPCQVILPDRSQRGYQAQTPLATTLPSYGLQQESHSSTKQRLWFEDMFFQNLIQDSKRHASGSPNGAWLAHGSSRFAFFALLLLFQEQGFAICKICVTLRDTWHRNHVLRLFEMWRKIDRSWDIL